MRFYLFSILDYSPEGSGHLCGDLELLFLRNRILVY